MTCEIDQACDREQRDRDLCAALDCAANAEDTTRQQTRLMRDQRARLGCA